MLVADSGPLISFTRAGLFPLLHRVLGKIVIPDAVYREIVVKGKGRPGALEAQNADWIVVKGIRHKKKPQGLRLGAGEAEAILLAKEQEAVLLIDDPVGRRVAKEQGLKYLAWRYCCKPSSKAISPRSKRPWISWLQWDSTSQRNSTGWSYRRQERIDSHWPWFSSPKLERVDEVFN